MTGGLEEMHAIQTPALETMHFDLNIIISIARGKELRIPIFIGFFAV